MLKSVIILIAMIVGLAGNVTASDLQMLTKEVNGDTVIICATPDEMGEIEMAFIKLYNYNKETLPGRLSEMELIGSSNAAYTVSGKNQVLEGKVEILLADLSKKIIRKDFILKN